MKERKEVTLGGKTTRAFSLVTNARGKRTRGEERAISHRGGHKYSGRTNINLIFSCENTIIRIKYRKTEEIKEGKELVKYG